MFTDDIDGAAAYVEVLNQYEYDDLQVPTGGVIVEPNAHSTEHSISKTTWTTRTLSINQTFDDYTFDLQLNRSAPWKAHLGVMEMRIEIAEEAEDANEQAIFLAGDISDFTLDIRPSKIMVMIGKPILTLIGASNHNKFGRAAVSILMTQAYQLVANTVAPTMTVRVHIKFTDYMTNYGKQVVAVTSLLGTFSYLLVKVFNPRMRVRRRTATRIRKKPRPPREMTEEEINEMTELAALADESMDLTDEELKDMLPPVTLSKDLSSSFYSFPELSD